MAKPGRNDPCPCGSGKKYKNCCQNTEIVSTMQAAWGQDPEWRKIRSTEGELTDAILSFGMGSMPSSWTSNAGTVNFGNRNLTCESMYKQCARGSAC